MYNRYTHKREKNNSNTTPKVVIKLQERFLHPGKPPHRQKDPLEQEGSFRDLGKREVTSLGQAGQSDSYIEGVLQLMRSPRVSYDSATATHSPWDLSPRSRLRRSRAVSGADGCGSGARLRGGPPSACHSTEALPSCGRLGVLQERPVQAPLSPPSGHLHSQ